MEDSPCPVVEFTSTVCPPCTGCACGSDWSGCFITQAMIDEGIAPTPLGDECEMTVIMTGTNTAGWTNPIGPGTEPITKICTTVAADGINSVTTIGMSANPAASGVWTDFGFYEAHIANLDLLQIRENAAVVWTGTVTAGDIYCVDKSSGTPTYTLNGTTIYTSTQTPTADCFLDGNSFGYQQGSGETILEVSACP